MTSLLPSPLPLYELPPPSPTALTGRSWFHWSHHFAARATQKHQPLPATHVSFCAKWRLKLSISPWKGKHLQRSRQTRGCAQARVLGDTICVTELAELCSGVSGPWPLLSSRWLPATASPCQRQLQQAAWTWLQSSG